MDHRRLLLLLVCVGWSSACFITNCPPGGKRSLRSRARTHRQCSTCGPEGKGHCFGPGICCGAEMGCVVSGKDTAVCLVEDSYPVPCDNLGEACGNRGGRCAIRGFCCSIDGCVRDESCAESNQPEEASSPAQRSFPLLVNLDSPPLLL